MGPEQLQAKLRGVLAFPITPFGADGSALDHGSRRSLRARHRTPDGILVLPSYYAQPDPRGLLKYYQAVASATSLGVMPYARDGAAFTVRLFQRIREHVVEQLGPERLVWLAGVGAAVMKAAMNLLGHPAGPVRQRTLSRREDCRL
jgi:dihydrodipicolinate synthase/N-acetylneuraminate lyase